MGNTKIYKCYFQWTFTLTLTLLGTLVASSAFAQPSDDYEDDTAISLPSHPTDADVVYWVDYDEENQWNEISQVVEPRHLAKRSPIPPFDPISKTKKMFKKFVVKPKTLKKLIKLSPKIKKLAKVSVPLAGVGGAGGLGGFGISQAAGTFGGTQGIQGFLPALPNFG